jgi:hypothetical protein
MVFSELVIGLPAWRLMASRWPVVTGTGQQRLRWLRRDSPSKDVSSKWQQRGTGYAEVHRTREVVLCGRLFGLREASPASGSALTRRKARPAPISDSFRCAVSALRQCRHLCTAPDVAPTGPIRQLQYIMRQSKFDKINAALDRAEFALEQLQKKVERARRKRASARTPEAIVALDLEAAEFLQELRKIRDAVHMGNPAPHLQLVQ